MSEWFKELVLKTSDPARDQGFESLSLRQFNQSANPKKLENGLSKLFSGFLFCSDNSVFFIVFFIRYLL